mmetsp:Transcript_8765/g.25276  ORF Transcript_8765/g.25276 Transcript_8765/m.25276 type:complete len:339 (-) Transcript_8765:763-1779(-)
MVLLGCHHRRGGLVVHDIGSGEQQRLWREQRRRWPCSHGEDHAHRPDLAHPPSPPPREAPAAALRGRGAHPIRVRVHLRRLDAAGRLPVGHQPSHRLLVVAHCHEQRLPKLGRALPPHGPRQAPPGRHALAVLGLSALELDPIHAGFHGGLPDKHVGAGLQCCRDHLRHGRLLLVRQQHHIRHDKVAHVEVGRGDADVLAEEVLAGEFHFVRLILAGWQVHRLGAGGAEEAHRPLAGASPRLAVGTAQPRVAEGGQRAEDLHSPVLRRIFEHQPFGNGPRLLRVRPPDRSLQGRRLVRVRCRLRADVLRTSRHFVLQACQGLQACQTHRGGGEVLIVL